MRTRRHFWGVIACCWSAIYLIMAVAWKLGLRNYPYGRHWDSSPHPVSLLDGFSRQTGGTIMIIGATIGLVGAVVLTRAVRRGLLVRAATVMIMVLGLGLILVGDYRPLMAIARTPVFVITQLFWGVAERRISVGEFVQAMFSVPAVHGFWQLAGLLILILAVRECWTRLGDGCRVCGRSARMSWWTTRDGARRWGLIATVIAAICPLPYALTRYLLLFGVPADGFSSEQIERMNAESPGIWIFGAALATFGVLGAVLTLGLIQRWGERWPFWIPGLRGRPINPWVAIVPAGLVSLLWPGASLMFLRMNVYRYQDGELSLLQLLLAPMTLWLFWGFALAAATVAYWLRRRPDCPVCERGVEPLRGIWVPKRQRPAEFSNRPTTAGSSLG